jgi:phosphohistidine phosphatase SixA
VKANDWKRRAHLKACWQACFGLATLSVLPNTWALGRSGDAWAAGRGRVLLLRHARAPGTFDPPEFRLGDCSTQRNLDPAGRAQAVGIGQWFKKQGLMPKAVRSSPWCRCMDTATLAFGRADAWDMLGSPAELSEPQKAQQLASLRRALTEVRKEGGLHVWVSHMFVQQDLSGASTAAGEGLLIEAAADGQASVLEVWRFGAPV